MKIKHSKLARRITALLSAVLLSEQLATTGAVLYVHAEDVQPENYSIDHNVTNSWDGGCSAEIILTNLADSETQAWEITFCTKDRITNLWGGTITECQEYLVEAASVELNENEEGSSEADVAETEEAVSTEENEDAEAAEESGDDAEETSEIEETEDESEVADESENKDAEESEEAQNEETEVSEDLEEAAEELENAAEDESAKAEEAVDADVETEENAESENAIIDALEEDVEEEAEESEEDAIYYQYTVEALDYNSVIAAGDHITIGYNADGNNHDIWDATAEIVLKEVEQVEEVEEAAVPTGGTYEGDGYSVEVRVPAHWDGAYNVQLSITNMSEETLHNWAFVMETNDSISGLYNAVELSNNDGVRLIKNAGYNQDIPAGGTVEIGYTANYDENFDVPSDFALSQIEKEVTTAECEVSLFITEEWEDGGLAEIILTNISEQPIEDWMLEFDSELDIVNIWDGVIVSHDGEHYYIRNAEYAQNIEVGESWTVGVLFSGNTADIRNVEVRQILAKDPSNSVERYDNLTDGIIDLGDIEYLRSMGELELSYHDDNRLSFILGDFYKRPINSKEDVANLLNISASLWGNGFVASADNISHQTSGVGDDLTNYYSYAPTVNGVPVFGSQINVMVDAKGTLCALFNSYESNIYSVNSTPSITAAQAEQIAMDAVMAKDEVKEFLDKSYDMAISLYGEGAYDREQVTSAFKELTSVSSSMYIHCFNYDETPRLIYEVRVYNTLAMETEDDVISIDFDESYYVLANGNAGRIYKVVSNRQYVSTTATDALNQTRNIEITQNGTNYELNDQIRNIQTYKSATQGTLWWVTYTLPGDLVTYDVNSVAEPEAVSVHANMEVVYDYYKNILHRNSYDGKGSAIIAIYGYKELYNNSYWDRNEKHIVFGKYGGLTRALDVCAHEFTHGVINSTVVYRINNNSYVKMIERIGETGSLIEAYGDIMGALIEGKTNDDKWIMGEDADAGAPRRSIKDPSLYAGFANHYSELQDEKYSNDMYAYSTIFSHAAYLMMVDPTNSGISDEKWAKVFYESLFNLNINATFLDARHSVVAVAKKNGFSGPQIQAIKKAFDDVGIVESDTLRIILTWGDTPSDLDSHLVGPALVPTGSRFHLYYGNKDIGSIENNTWVADLDYDDTTARGPEVITLRKYIPGTYYYYVYNFSNHGILNSKDLANSNATVKVYRGDDLIPSNTFSVVPNKSGVYWNVFEITIDDHINIQISSIDSYTTTAIYR